MRIHGEFTQLHADFRFGCYHNTVNSFFIKYLSQYRRGGMVGDAAFFIRIRYPTHKQDKDFAMQNCIAKSREQLSYAEFLLYLSHFSTLYLNPFCNQSCVAKPVTEALSTDRSMLLQKQHMTVCCMLLQICLRKRGHHEQIRKNDIIQIFKGYLSETGHDL